MVHSKIYHVTYTPDHVIHSTRSCDQLTQSQREKAAATNQPIWYGRYTVRVSKAGDQTLESVQVLDCKQRTKANYQSRVETNQPHHMLLWKAKRVHVKLEGK